MKTDSKNKNLTAGGVRSPRTHPPAAGPGGLCRLQSSCTGAANSHGAIFVAHVGKCALQHRKQLHSEKRLANNLFKSGV